MWTGQSVSTKGQRQHCGALVKPKPNWCFIREATIYGTHIKLINPCQIFVCHSQTTNYSSDSHPLRMLHSEWWIINQFSPFVVYDTTLFSKCQGKWIVVTAPCICLWDSKHQDKTNKIKIHSTSLHVIEPTTGAELIWGVPWRWVRWWGWWNSSSGATLQTCHHCYFYTQMGPSDD